MTEDLGRTGRLRNNGNINKLRVEIENRNFMQGLTMSQEDVYKLLEELGGEATTTQVSKLAKKKYPKYTVYTYVSARLKSLQKWGYVRRNPDGKWSTTNIQPPWKTRVYRDSAKIKKSKSQH